MKMFAALGGSALALLASVGIGLGVASSDAEARTFLRIAGGIGGSSWEVTAGKLGNMFSNASPDIQAIAQPGNMGENLARLKRGEADLGITYGFVFRDVASGTGDFGAHHNPDLRLLAALYPAYQQPLVKNDAPWTSLRDLAKNPGDINIVMLTPGSATYVITEAMLRAVGIELDDIRANGGLTLPLNYSQGLDALRTGRANIVSINGPQGHPSVLEFENQGRLLTFDQEAIDKMVELLPGSAPATIDADSYAFLSEPYDTVAVFTSLVVNASVPEEVVYTITKAFWENVDEFRATASYARATDISNAMVGSEDLPVHPGALRYYREKGLVN